MSSASTAKSISCKLFTKVSHVTGFWPFPPIHFSKMAWLISLALHFFSLSMPEVIAPLSSLSSVIPKSLYFVLICSGMLILLHLPGNFSSLHKLGLSSVANHVCIKKELSQQSDIQILADTQKDHIDFIPTVNHYGRLKFRNNYFTYLYKW